MGNNKSKLDPSQLKAERKINNELDAQIWKDKERDAEIIKLLLLGAGESGKSTLFKQMIRIYGTGFTEKDLLLYIPMVHTNTVSSMKELCYQSDVLGASDSACLVTDEAVLPSKRFMDEMKLEEKLDETVAKHINILWKDPGIKRTYESRAKFQLMDTCNYFFDDIFRISQPKYLPTDSDLIYCRVRTTGIVENKFIIDDNRFLMVDVGGQRNERKKWIHCFEGVTAVIFVADVSEYDKVLYEDGQTNRMHEALKLFGETVALKWFAKTSFLLFLNKRDLFADKIAKVPLTVCFPEYTQPNEYDAALEFIRLQFEARSHGEKLYVHVTCATDSNNVQAVFGACKDIIISKHLRESGLI